jgi:hypothetical protein
MGGYGVFTRAEEYIKILRALLTTDEDEMLLEKDTLKEFFKPQLGEAASAAMNAMYRMILLVQYCFSSESHGNSERYKSTTQWVEPEKTRRRNGALVVFSF